MVVCHIHAIKRIIDGLSVLANALAPLPLVFFQLLDLGLLALPQLLGVDARDWWLSTCPTSGIGVLVGGEGQDLERSNVLEGNNVVVTGLVCQCRGRVGRSRGGVDCDDIELGAGCKEGAFECL